jgi:hypothetical protein
MVNGLEIYVFCPHPLPLLPQGEGKNQFTVGLKVPLHEGEGFRVRARNITGRVYHQAIFCAKIP